MYQIFFDNNGTLRSGWRAASFLFAFIFCSAILNTIVIFGLSATGVSIGPTSRITLAASSLASLIPAILLGRLFGRFFERLPGAALGFSFGRDWDRHTILGLLFGAGTLAAAVLVPVVLGGLRFSLSEAAAVEIFRSITVSLVIFAIAAAFEEALFRGYIFQTFTRAGLGWFAILLTSIFFGFVHVRNPSAGLFSTVNTVIAGVWFGVAYLKTRDLWFVWGMHFMWNWLQGSILGIEVSGLSGLISTSLLKEVDTGPSWLTGANYGIEGSVACTIALLISTMVIWRTRLLCATPPEALLDGTGSASESIELPTHPVS